jgi:hypothetical protein
MVSRRAALVLAFAALSGGAIGACGGGGIVDDSVPKSTPDLTVPRGGTDLSAASPATSTTSTTGTTTTPTTTSGATTTGAAPAAPVTSTPATTTPSGGVAPTTPTTTPATGGTPSGGFSDFCKQNPGACGQ